MVYILSKKKIKNKDVLLLQLRYVVVILRVVGNEADAKGETKMITFENNTTGYNSLLEDVGIDVRAESDDLKLWRSVDGHVISTYKNGRPKSCSCGGSATSANKSCTHIDSVKSALNELSANFGWEYY